MLDKSLGGDETVDATKLLCVCVVASSVPDEDSGLALNMVPVWCRDVMSEVSADLKVKVAGETHVCALRAAVGVMAVVVASKVADKVTKAMTSRFDGMQAKLNEMTSQPSGKVCSTSVVECMVSNPTQWTRVMVMSMWKPADVMKKRGMSTSDMCKMMFGSCAPEKHVAIRGGGMNYCTGSHDCASTKDNYCCSRKGGDLDESDQVACVVCKVPLKSDAETEAELTCERESVSKVKFERTTSDNTLTVDTKKRAKSRKGTLKIEVLGGTMSDCVKVAVVMGAMVTLSGRSMYSQGLTDSMSERKIRRGAKLLSCGPKRTNCCRVIPSSQAVVL